MIGTLDNVAGMLGAPTGVVLDATHILAPTGWMLIAVLAASIAAIVLGSTEHLGTTLAGTWARPLVELTLDAGALVVSCGWSIVGLPVKTLLALAITTHPAAALPARLGEATGTDAADAA